MKRISLRHLDRTDTLLRVGRAIWLKVENEPTYDSLTQEERNFVFVDIAEGRLSDSGFDGLFRDVAGQYAHQILAAYQAIGATETAGIVDTALRGFPILPVPIEQKERHVAMESLPDTVSDRWAQLDCQFRDSSEDIIGLIHRYVHTNHQRFDWATDDEMRD